MFVSFHGFESLWAIDLHPDILLALLYCAIPAASICVFLFARSHVLELALHAVVALGYLTVYTLLNWRTCAADGYCISIGETLTETLRTMRVEAAFGVVVFAVACHWLDGKRAGLGAHSQ
jgi:hypothetical protein